MVGEVDASLFQQTERIENTLLNCGIVLLLVGYQASESVLPFFNH